MDDKLGRLCEIVVDDKRSVVVSQHNGMVWFVSCYGGYVNFCKQQVFKDSYRDKPSPVSVCLGDRSTAVRVMLEAITSLRKLELKKTA